MPVRQQSHQCLLHCRPLPYDRFANLPVYALSDVRHRHHAESYHPKPHPKPHAVNPQPRREPSPPVNCCTSHRSTRSEIMKMNPSVKVSLVALSVAAAGYLAFWGWSEVQIGGFNPEPIQPGEVSLIAVDTGLGYRVRVANAVAQLVQVDEAQLSGRSSGAEGDTEDVRRIPIRELLRSLQFDEKALGHLVATVNNLNIDDVAPSDNVWKAEDLQKALEGDPSLKARLVADLNVNLDGSPTDEIRFSNILNGILIDLPVPVQVPAGDSTKTLTARVPIPYQPAFTKRVADVIGKRFNPTEEFITGNYRVLAQDILDGVTPKENVARAIQNLISDQKKKSLAEKPERILQGSKVLVNDTMVNGARLSSYKDEKEREFFNITLDLTEEGRKRLWKYSRDTEGFALLLVVDGVAVAAPRITTPLTDRQVTITALRDRRLSNDSVQKINAIAQKTRNSEITP